MGNAMLPNLVPSFLAKISLRKPSKPHNPNVGCHTQPKSCHNLSIRRMPETKNGEKCRRFRGLLTERAMLHQPHATHTQIYHRPIKCQAKLLPKVNIPPAGYD
jgi:hypothetical protein